jgi:hypothetical protein
MPYGTVNADVITTSTAGGVLGAGNASIMKNRIINGAMVIDQRNGGASVATSGGSNIYTLDRWQALYSQTSKFTIQQNAGSVTPPVGFVNYLGVTSTSAYTVGAGELFLLRQRIEGYNIADLGWGTANAKTVTFSFQVYSSLTGTFGGTLNSDSDAQSYPFTYTISSANTWTSISVTIAGPTSGTWLKTNGSGIIVTFGLGVGATYSGTAGSWSTNSYYSATGAVSVVGTSGATFYITGVQLEVGSSATGFDYRIYGTELANCERYYQKIGTTDDGGSTRYVYYATGSAISTTQADIMIPLKVDMRVTPTIAYSGTIYVSGAFGSSAVSSIAGNYGGRQQVGIYVNASSLTSGQGCTGFTGGTSSYVTANAEL